MRSSAVGMDDDGISFGAWQSPSSSSAKVLVLVIKFSWCINFALFAGKT